MSDSEPYPYVALEALAAPVFREVWLAAVFDQFKWDTQIGDTAVLADFPLLLSKQAWKEVSQLAERLAAEAISAESELLCRPELHSTLGLPGEVRRAWRKPEKIRITSERDVRIIRFDFHFTTEGWRISEANIDTPGGLIESSGFSNLMRARYPDVQLTGEPAETLVRVIRERIPAGGLVGLIHATAYSDDRQMMIYVNRLLEQEGLRGCLISPAQLRWHDGQAAVMTNWEQGEVSYLVRFFPAEWLPNLPRQSKWERYFDDCRVPASNPVSALLVQSKRFPLVWDKLKMPIPTWRTLLPETRDPRSIDQHQKEGWVFKPVFGRAGDHVALYNVTPPKEWDKVWKAAHRYPNEWIAQRRFEPIPVMIKGSPWYPSLGVYTVNGCAAGIYGRIATRPLINGAAKDIAVFIASEGRNG